MNGLPKQCNSCGGFCGSAPCEYGETIYQQHGHADRHAYFMYLTEKYKLPLDVIMRVADGLSWEKDFTKLVECLDVYVEGMNCG